MNDLEYLQNVLKNWSEFCKCHKKFERAIQNILIENFMLKEEIENLKCQKSTK